MKIIYFPVFFLFFGTISSQTLTQVTHEPLVGDNFQNLILDTSGFSTGMPSNLIGTGKLFDFTKLKSSSTIYPTTYLAASSVSNAANYPGCNLVQSDPGLTTFLKSSTTPTTQTEVLGVFSGSAISLTFSNSAVAAVFPVSFGSTKTDNMAGTFTLATLNGNCSGKITVTADATGTLSLPDGFVYNNVIRVKSVQTLTATQGFIPLGTLKQTVISYYDVSKRYPLLTLDYSAFVPLVGTASITAVARGNKESYIVGLHEQQSNTIAFSVFPNPAKEKIWVAVTNFEGRQVSIRVVNQLGQTLKEAISAETNLYEISITDFKAGIYFVVVRDGSYNSTKKFVVVE